MRTFRSTSTPWTDIIAAQNNPALVSACLEQLAEKYHEPIQAFIRYRFNITDPDKLTDLTQAFFLHFIEGNLLSKLDRERGRLRNWFMTSVRRFVLDEKRKGDRGNMNSPLCKLERPSAGDIASRANPGPTPEDEFNRIWARKAFDDAVKAFRHECRDKGRPHYFQVFERHALTREKTDTPSYEATAAELGISVKDVSNYLGRAKKKFQALLREQIRATVASDEDVDDELHDLIKYFK